MYWTGLTTASTPPFFYRMSRSTKVLRQPTSDFEMIVQKVLLSKGPMVTPRIVNSIMSGRKSVSEIVEVMRAMDREGLGEYFDDMRTKLSPGAPRKMFVKKSADEIMDDLERYGVSPSAYEEIFAFGPHFPSVAANVWYPPREQLLCCTEQRVARIVRKILLEKGQLVSPRQVSMHMSGNERVETIVTIMRRLSAESVGIFYELYSRPPMKPLKRVFLKRPTAEIYVDLVRYGINASEYEDKFQQLNKYSLTCADSLTTTTADLHPGKPGHVVGGSKNVA
ncbi:hypothetical protein LSH36_375g02002 [Paralvinella palmiformis]|uniref:Uncharacterized protein n=1 Tax=Paralvinella palmiformis TaxID=53620 RepID=A0AAD9MZE9_9ANNE|nr:hypothetical protein LSH36_375g02002 [Paralvinella palmiformis]